MVVSVHPWAGVGLIGEDGFDPREEPSHGANHPLGAVAVLDVGGVDHGDQQEANGIDQDVSLPALDLLGRVIARNAAVFRDFHRLTVDHRGRGTGLAPLPLARLDG